MNAQIKSREAVEGGSPTDPQSTSRLVMSLLRGSPRRVDFVLAVAGAPKNVISGLEKRRLVICSRKAGKEMVRLSVAGIAVASAVSEAYRR